MHHRPTVGTFGTALLPVAALTLLLVVALTLFVAPAAADHGGGHLGDDTHVVCSNATQTHGNGGGGGGNGGASDDRSADRGGPNGGLDDPSNCEYHRIQNAVDASTPGDLVYVQAGTYHQHVVVDDTSNLTIAGAGRDSTVLVGPKANLDDHGGNETNDTGSSSYPRNPFTDPEAYVRYVVNYPVEWTEAHANDPYGKASMHYDQARNYTGVPGPALPEQDDDHGHVPTYDGFSVTSDDVTIRDLEVRKFAGDGVYYDGVTGFRVANVDAINNGGYGVYAIRSTVGVFEDSYASGHYDSGFYLGEVRHCDCIIRNVTAEENLLGYSGTGASYITIEDSVWRDNAAGIVPNVLPNEPAPQTNLRVVDNRIANNDNRTAYRDWHFAGSLHAPVGSGVIIAGGSFNTVRGNVIVNHSRGGVVITNMFTQPSGNSVVANEFERNDLDVWWDGGGANNCFAANNDGSNANGTLRFDAGAYWNAHGELPRCTETPNAAPPDPQQLAEIGSVVVYGCEFETLQSGEDPTSAERCHVEEPAPHVHPPSAAPSPTTIEAMFGPDVADLLRGIDGDGDRTTDADVPGTGAQAF